MRIQKSIASIVIAGSLLVGGASVASASPAAVPAHKPSAECVTALKSLRAEFVEGGRLEQQAKDLLRLRTFAVRHHRTDAVKVIDAKLAALKVKGAALRAEIAAQKAVVKTACAPAASAA